MKTRVKTLCDDAQHNDYRKGEEGYIDGYIRGGNNAPFACVVLLGKCRIVLIPLYNLQVIKEQP